MRAHLTLRPARGHFKQAVAFPTAATIRESLASESTVQQVVEIAESLGFTVVDASPLQVTIEGPKSQFERVFSARLGSPRAQSKGKASRKSSERPERPAPAYSWVEPPTIPEELRDAVGEVVLPHPIAVHG